jgi:hypothetical protein
MYVVKIIKSKKSLTLLHLLDNIILDITNDEVSKKNDASIPTVIAVGTSENMGNYYSSKHQVRVIYKCQL